MPSTAESAFSRSSSASSSAAGVVAVLPADVGVASGVVADQDDGEAGGAPGAGCDLEGAGGDFGADLGGDVFGFEQLGHRIFFLPR